VESKILGLMRRNGTRAELKSLHREAGEGDARSRCKKNVQKTSHRERELTKSLETMKQSAKEMPRYPEAEL